jgi:hypothetical protein
LVDFLLLHIVSLQKTMGGDDIARTNVKAKLMADQGMADAVVRNLIYSGGDMKGFYQILALKTYVTRHLFLHVGYQLSKFKDPNNLMLGLGYRFHDKR